MSASRELCLTFLDVGQGDATIILPPKGEGDPVVFDCGRDGWEVAQQLRVWGVESIEAVIASHLDLDHVGGMATLLDAYRGHIGAVYFSPDRDITDEHDDAKTAKRLADRVHEGSTQGGWELREVYRDARQVSGGDDWSIHIVAPRARVRGRVARTDAWDAPNRYSAVLRVEMAGKTVLIGADAPLITWSEMAPELKSDVFRVPHHGGALNDGGVPEGWSASRLYGEVDPGVAVLSVGTNNAHGHPENPEWIGPVVARGGCRLLCTQVTGRCHSPFDTAADPDLRSKAIRTARERFLPAPHGGTSHFSEPPWRHYTQRTTEPVLASRSDRLEVPCAGTISVRIDDRGEIRVDPSGENPSLGARIDGWSSPLCRRPEG